MLSVMMTYLSDEKMSVLNRVNHYGKTPLVLVAEGPNNENSEQCARLLIKTSQVDARAG